MKGKHNNESLNLQIDLELQSSSPSVAGNESLMKSLAEGGVKYEHRN